jgi:toxin ParE1/3/4
VSRRLVVSPRAQADVDEHAAYLDDRNPDAGWRFLVEIHDAFDRLPTFPHLGQAWPTTRTELVGVRRLVLTTFPISLFYRATETVVEVLRVLHHARDIPPLLDDL